MRRQGLSYRRIAAQVGVSHETVRVDLADAPSLPVVRAAWTRTPHPCEDCGATTDRHSDWCAECAAKRLLAAWQRKNLKRRADGEPLSVTELGERDRWRCHLCRRPVNPATRWPDPWSASRDHLVPVADGGSNDPANLALAHLRCNVRRGTGGAVQLQLVG